MSPDQVLSKLLDLNRPAAIFLLSGMAVFAAVAIVSGWSIDRDAAAVFALYIIGFAAFLYIIVIVLSDRFLKRILGYFSTALFICWTTAIFVSTIVPGATPLPSPVCLIQFLRDDCNFTDKDAANKKVPPVARVEPVVPAPSSQVRQGDYKVFVQFAGAIVRDNVRAMMTKLRTEGWKVQGVEGGGERTAKAAGYNEIRYSSDDDENAAKELARSVQANNLTPKAITISKTFTVPTKTLEVWISR